METTYLLIMIEDNPGDVRLIKEMLAEIPNMKYTIDVAETLSAGVEKLSGSTKYDILLLDLNLPDSTGIDTFNQIHKKKFDLPIVILTGIHDVELAITAVRHGAQDFLEKNTLTKNELAKCISYAIERYFYYKSQLDAIKKHLENIHKNTDKIVATQEALLNKITCADK